MAIITIDNIAIPDPSGMTVSYFDLSSTESGRTLSGEMVKDIVARKTKLNLSWKALNWNDASLLLNTVERNEMMNVRYPDVKARSYITKTMYVGDRTAPALNLVRGEEYWDGISFELIEK